MKISGTPANSICLLTLFFLFFTTAGHTQSSLGPRNASVFSNDNAIGSYAFSTPADAGVHDNQFASAAAILSILTGNTNYLKTTGFGFSLPATASITGIVVEVEKKATNINFLTSITDNNVRLIKNGTLTGSNRAKPADWTSSPGYFTYGSSSDLWGTTWSPADINAADFGLAFSAKINGLISLLPVANIDHVRMTVYFNIVLPLNFVEFTAAAKDHHLALLRWTASADENIASINIQRMTAPDNWKTIHTLQNVTTMTRSYEYTDAGCTAPLAYYRLQAVYTTGKTDYSIIIPVKWEKLSVAIYPNPASYEFFIEEPALDRVLQCTGMDGRSWLLSPERSGQGYKVDIRHLPRGLYAININDKRELFIKN